MSLKPKETEDLFKFLVETSFFCAVLIYTLALYIYIYIYILQIKS